MTSIVDLLNRIGGDRLARMAMVLLVFVILVRGIRLLVSRNIAEPEARYRINKFLGAGAWIIAALLLFGSFSGSLSSALASLSVIGAGVAFALQEVIASVAGRIAVLSGRFFKVGDRVQLGGIKGDVIDIGVLRTTVMEIGDWVKGDLYTGRVVRIANSFVLKEPVFNYSGDFGFLWDEITLPVSYGADHHRTRAMLEQVVQEEAGEHVGPAQKEWREMLARYRIENARVEPLVTLVLNDNWMEFTARYVVPFDRRRGVKDRIFTRILSEVNASNGAIALASATSAIVACPPVDVRLIRDTQSGLPTESR
jgi:small-conductance mechanosensitive channel